MGCVEICLFILSLCLFIQNASSNGLFPCCKCNASRMHRAAFTPLSLKLNDRSFTSKSQSSLVSCLCNVLVSLWRVHQLLQLHFLSLCNSHAIQPSNYSALAPAARPRYVPPGQGVFCGSAARTPVPKCSGCIVGADGVVAATCAHTTTCTGCALRATRQTRHNKANNQTNQSVLKCAKVGTKVAIVEVNKYFSHDKMALR